MASPTHSQGHDDHDHDLDDMDDLEHGMDVDMDSNAASPADESAPGGASAAPRPANKASPPAIAPAPPAGGSPASNDEDGSKKRSGSPTSSSGRSKKTNGPAGEKKEANGANGSSSNHAARKRRAARACVSCRARKVRCDVVEGAPCGNCRWDNVECVVQESRRRKKHLFAAAAAAAAAANGTTPATAGSADSKLISQGMASAQQMQGAVKQPLQASTLASQAAVDDPSSSVDGHVPHLIYQQSGLRRDSIASNGSNGARVHWATSSGGPGLRTAAYLASLVEPDAASQLPAFIRPLPAKISDDDVDYLVRKRALTLPSIPLQNALLRAYVEYVHPYMPLLELHDFLAAVNSRDGLGGQVSLLLYQAVMFAAVAFVDIQHLRDAGFPNRKAARKALYKRARLLYDFDYESDRLIIIQSLLLMSYWYETPDDQKDTWHWIGVAISLAHTIGLHRNPCNANMSPRKQKLWKRIWWSGFMRDRLIALGMRRPMRVQDDEFDVPMLEESDFDTDPLPDDVTVIGPECTIMRDSNAQRELAQMCVAKARLCVLVGHMLRAQYSVLMRDKARPDNTVNSTMMLFPHRKLDNYENVNLCDLKLLAWADSLPASCEYRPITPEDISSGLGTVALQRTLLHMVFHTTISALHRPQIQPVGPTRASQPVSQIQEMARRRVRDAAMHITRMCAELHQMRLDRYLPTTGVTVVLPALITHLVDIKNSDAQIRERAARGFRLCLKVMERMRDAYTAADYASIFVNEALRKATGVELNGNGAVRSLTPGTALGWKVLQAQQQRLAASSPTPPPLESNMSYTASAETQIYQNRGRMQHNQQPQGQPQPTVQQPQQQQQQMPSPYLGQRHPTPMPATAAPNLSVSTSTTEFVVPPAPTLHPHRINATNSPPPLSDNKDFDSAVGLTPTGTGSEMGSGSGSSHSGGIDQDGGLHYHNGHGQPGAYNSYHSANTANSNALLLNFELDLPGDFIDADFGNDVVGFASGSGGHMQMDMDIMSGTIGDGGANGTGGGSNGTDAATAAAAAATANALLFDWDAPSSALDFDQWLQFPPTDANNATGVNTVGSGTNGANPLGPGHVQHRDGMQGDEEMQQPQRRTVKAEHEELDENDADAQFIRALLREAPSSNIGDNKGTGATEQPKEGPARDWRMQDESLMTAIAEAVKSANQAEDTKMTVADDHDNRKRASVADAADKGLVVAGDGMQGVEMDADSDAMRMLVLAPGLD